LSNSQKLEAELFGFAEESEVGPVMVEIKSGAISDR
jgi:hypothetical protein